MSTLLDTSIVSKRVLFSYVNNENILERNDEHEGYNER